MGPRGFKVTDERKVVDVQKGRQAEKCQKVQTKVFQIPHYFKMKQTYITDLGRSEVISSECGAPATLTNLKEILCITLYDLYGNPQIETSFQDFIDDIYFICPDFPLFYLF